MFYGMAPSRFVSSIGRVTCGFAFLALRMDPDMYFSSPVEPARFQALRIALTETTTHIQEYRSGKANIPSQVLQVLMGTGSGASAETEN
jgi:hypothetical protein